MPTTPEQKKSNLRLGLILASVAAVFFIGFMVKMVLLSSR
ncbi:MAG: cytochrome oxidase small assembly protein [Pseudomonadota bacterium]